MTHSDILLSAAALIDKGHSKGAFRRNAAGLAVRLGSPEVAKWDANAALYDTAPNRTVAHELIYLLAGKTEQKNLPLFNDASSASEVSALMREVAGDAKRCGTGATGRLA